MSLFSVLFPLLFLWWVVRGTRQLVRPQGARVARANTAPSAPAGEAPADAFAARREQTKVRWRGALSIALGMAGWWAFGYGIAWRPAAQLWRASNAAAVEQVALAEGTEFFHTHDCVGLSIVAVVDDQTCVLGLGQRSLWDRRPPDGETQFEIGSITKTFTGLLLADLIEQQRLGLEDPVAGLLPEGYQLPASASGKITLRQLVTHTAGFPRLPNNLMTAGNVLRIVSGGDPYRAYSPQQFREAVASLQLNSEPGTKAEYSNFSAALLGTLLAHQWGVDYGTAVRTRIFEPLGMEHSTCSAMNPRQTRGYRETRHLGPLVLAKSSAPWRLPAHLAGAGGICSTPEDMLRYLQAHMGLLRTSLSAAIERSHEPLFQADDGREFAMHWIRQADHDGDGHLLWHNGGTGGYRSFLGFSEDGRVGVVVLANSQANTDALGQQILRALTRLRPETD